MVLVLVEKTPETLRIDACVYVGRHAQGVILSCLNARTKYTEDELPTYPCRAKLAKGLESLGADETPEAVRARQGGHVRIRARHIESSTNTICMYIHTYYEYRTRPDLAASCARRR